MQIKNPPSLALFGTQPNLDGLGGFSFLPIRFFQSQVIGSYHIFCFQIIKTLEIVFTPPIPNISTTITPSTVYAVQGQPLTLTARTFLDGTAFLSEEWYYPLNYIINPDQTPTGYSLGTMVGETTADGYRVSTLTFDSFPAPGEYLFEYVVFNDLYGYSSSQSNGSITVVVSAAP